MSRLTDRRAMLLAAGTVVFAAAAVPGGAQSTDIRGTVEYEGGQAIPEGQLQVHLDGPAAAQKQASTAQVESDGGAKTIEFTFTPPTDSASQEVIATLQRADGWLLAQGSAQYQAGTPLHIVLYTAMYDR